MRIVQFPDSTMARAISRWIYRIQIAVILGVAALLIWNRPQEAKVQVRLWPTLFDAVSQFTRAATRFDTAVARPWLVGGQEAAYEEWARFHLHHAFHATPTIEFTDFRLRIEKEALPLTWVEVTLPRTVVGDAVVYEAWWQDAEGNWRFDCEATMRRLTEKMDVPDLPPVSSEPLLLL